MCVNVIVPTQIKIQKGQFLLPFFLSVVKNKRKDTEDNIAKIKIGIESLGKGKKKRTIIATT